MTSEVEEEELQAPFCKGCRTIAQTIPDYPWLFETVPTDDPSECSAPWCRPDLYPEPCEHPRTDQCTGGERSDPGVCTCKDNNTKELHDKILACISKIEHSFYELRIARGATIRLTEQVKKVKQVDPAEPGHNHERLAALSTLVMNLDLDGDRIDTQPRRPLAPVFCTEEMHCHYAKVFKYAPANCDCTPTACSCGQCILHRVEHCVEDYQDAVQRACLGITKLQAARKPTSTPGTTPLSPDHPASDGCAMPGVRKAKHLKSCTKAQKDTYNRLG